LLIVDYFFWATLYILCYGLRLPCDVCVSADSDRAKHQVQSLRRPRRARQRALGRRRRLHHRQRARSQRGRRRRPDGERGAAAAARPLPPASATATPRRRILGPAAGPVASRRARFQDPVAPDRPVPRPQHHAGRRRRRPTRRSRLVEVVARTSAGKASWRQSGAASPVPRLPHAFDGSASLGRLLIPTAADRQDEQHPASRCAARTDRRWAVDDRRRPTSAVTKRFRARPWTSLSRQLRHRLVTNAMRMKLLFRFVASSPSLPFFPTPIRILVNQ